MTAIHLDFYPADLVVGETRLEKVRVVLTGTHALAFATLAGVPVLVGRAATGGTDGTTLDASGATRKIRTDIGEWAFQKSRGCGCGSPLKRVDVNALIALADPAAVGA